MVLVNDFSAEMARQIADLSNMTIEKDILPDIFDSIGARAEQGKYQLTCHYPISEKSAEKVAKRLRGLGYSVELRHLHKSYIFVIRWGEEEAE